MATKKGALSVALDPNLPETQEYREQIGALANSLMPDAESDRSERLMAFGAGLSSPGDQAGALSRALGAELKQRNEQKTLKAQYVPLVMTALANQAAAAQTNKLNTLLGALDFSNMTPEQVAAVETATGAKLRELYELDRFGKSQAPGSFSVKTDGTREHFPDLKTGVTLDSKNVARPIPQLAQILAQGNALDEYWKRVAQAQVEPQAVFKNGVPGIEGTKASTLGLPPGPPIVPGGGLDQPQGSMPPPQGATPPRPAQPPAVQAPPATVGRPRVTPEVQAGRDDERVAILRAEAGKAQQQLVAAQQAGDRESAMRAQSDLESIQRELARLPGGAGKSPPAAPQAAPTTTGPAGGAGFVQTGPSATQTASAEALKMSNEDWIKNSYRVVQDEGSNASKVKTGVSVMRTALAGLGDNGTGWGAEQKKKATQIASALGMKNAKEVASNYEIFQSQVGQHLFDLLGAQKGPQTEGDADRAKETLVGLGKTRRANEFLIDLAEATAERQMKRANFYREMRPEAMKTGDLSSIDHDWATIAPSVFDSPIMRRWKVKK